jgi:hypothetical protein
MKCAFNLAHLAEPQTIIAMIADGREENSEFNKL